MEFKLSNLTANLGASQAEPIRLKTLILGSGPAGLTAALYAARAELQPLVLTGMDLGGQASLTNTIENYPGFPDGVGGSQLGELFQKQAERFGARFEFDLAREVDLSSRPFRVISDNGVYLSETLIVTTGASPNHLQVAGEIELTGKGVSYCATCDGFFFKEKEIVVVGGGDSALEEAIFLTRFATQVTIIHRRDALRAGSLLQRQAHDNPKIRFIFNAIVTGILGEHKVDAVRLRNVQTKEEITHPTQGVFIFVGHTPNTSIFKGKLEMDERGYLLTNNLMQTNVPGVLAGGEVCDPNFRQVVTSAGMGAAAAIQAARFLEANA